MRFLILKLRDYWRFMLVAPWRTVKGEQRRQGIHTLYWLLGWVWLLAGFTAGSFASLDLYHRFGFALLQNFGLVGSQAQNGFTTAVAFIAGFFIQVVGALSMIILTTVTAPFIYPFIHKPGHRVDFAITFVVVTAALIPLVLCGGFVWWYLANFVSDPALVITGVLGAIALKLLSLLVPSVLSVLWRVFKRFIGATPSGA